MSKLSKQDKIEIYKRRLEGEKISRLSFIFGVNQSIIKYLVRLISFHGLQILDKDGNRHYAKELKTQIINEVIIQGKSAYTVAIEYALQITSNSPNTSESQFTRRMPWKQSTVSSENRLRQRELSLMKTVC